ncbi:hypothetical protein JQS43_01610 [Natronosporangium hydrolyticum]|uniref:Glycerophosphoryl diester phosphodiesterase membrane domain-containing protein n=1 Tax=Natronosporangium hydrolyticum TaxID=2811111 RepID=A0A895YG77_9ACTN|nr:hypothetical protein [Natronosporangium hydrolyticum]QSB15102.1 hypothetical protein JQS43_01610 [Natronosporangium hydrolyticum]
MSPPPSHPDPYDPTSYGHPAGGPPDPLVPAPAGGLAALLERLVATLRRSGRSLLWIMLLTFALPQVVWTALLDSISDGTLPYGSTVAVDPETAEAEPFAPLEEMFGAVSGEGWLMIVAATVGVAAFAALGWAASVWAVTQAAAGLPVTVAEALPAGMRRMLPMLGWYLVYGLLIAVGLVLCVLPGLYLAAAAALFGFVVVYERGRNPIARSFQLVHQGLGAGLARVALLFTFMLLASCLLGGVTALLGLGTAETTTGRIAGSAVDSLLTLPLSIVLLVGLLLTYAQSRARLEPLTTVVLWNEANPPEPTAPGYPTDPAGGPAPSS